VAHLALIAFSSLAMVTVLNGAPGPWLTSEPNATVMRIAWAWSGPTYVVLGALTALWHAGGRIGVRRALAIFAIASLVSLGAELTGTSTGLPFGDYKYTPLLGWRVFGLVPFPIPISWFYMLYCCLAMLGRFIPAADDRATRWRWAALAGLVLVAWDVSMDPAMVKTSHWLWGAGRMFTELGLPAWLVAFFTKDIFYGMPLSNWFGWYLTGTLIAWLMLAVVSPTTVARSVSPSRLPIWLYATNGIMPVVLCLRDGMWWAAGLGAIAMAIPVGLALRGGPQRSGATVAPRVTAAI
jgi:putative membrane protein